MRQRLADGDIAPDFNVKDMNGHAVSLANRKGEYVLLAFMRYSGCPYCNLAIHRLALEHATLQRQGCSVVAFIQSDKTAIRTNIYDRHAVKPDFPIVADPAMHVYEQYGVTTSIAAILREPKTLPYWVHAVRHHGFGQKAIDGKFFLVPAYFLIETASKRIIRTLYGASFYEHETFTRIYQPLVFRERPEA